MNRLLSLLTILLICSPGTSAQSGSMGYGYNYADSVEVVEVIEGDNAIEAVDSLDYVDYSL